MLNGTILYLSKRVDINYSALKSFKMFKSPLLDWWDAEKYTFQRVPSQIAKTKDPLFKGLSGSEASSH